jgi:hypothetical protein
MSLTNRNWKSNAYSILAIDLHVQKQRVEQMISETGDDVQRSHLQSVYENLQSSIDSIIMADKALGKSRVH